MKQKAIDMINDQIEGNGYKKYSNEWNVANQLIDIIAVSDNETAEIVLRDLDIKEMAINALVSTITGKRMANPEEVMKTISEFYKITAPSELPPQAWRTQGQASTQSSFNLLDFI